MNYRGVAFTTCLTVTAITTTVPVVLLVGAIALDTYNNGGRVNGGLAGLDRTSVNTELDSATLVQDRFQVARLVGSRQQASISLKSIDPENRSMALEPQNLAVVGNSPPLNGGIGVIGDAEHLWGIDTFSDRVYERRGSEMIALTNFPADAFGSWRPWNERREFVLNGSVYCVTKLPTMEREIFKLVGDKWISLGEIQLFDEAHYYQSEDFRRLLGEGDELSGKQQAGGTSAPLRMNNRRGLSAQGKIQILPIGSEWHVFWQLPDRILYRRGIELAPSSFQYGPTGKNPSDRNPVVSALKPANVDLGADGWTLVSKGLNNDTEWYRLSVGGKPAVVLVDRSNPSSPVAKALWIENGTWAEFAATQLPLLSHIVAAGSRDDGSMAYLATATPLGRAKILALEPTGFRLTSFEQDKQEQSRWIHGVAGYVFISVYLVFSLLMGSVLAIVAFILMSRDTGRYTFGFQEIGLPSILERGAARILDLLLILLATAGTLFVLNRIFQPDWITFFEAMQHFDESGRRQPLLDLPPVIIALRIIITCVFILVATWGMLVVMQGRYGITPGKWICRLQTVRTSLRPCGFAHSLFRELMMCIDCLNFICWTPGILSIAFSSSRQRLGDRLADTIVIRRTR